MSEGNIQGDLQPTIQNLMKKCIVNLYYEHPDEEALGYGTAYVISQDLLLTPANNIYDKISNKYHQNIYIQLPQQIRIPCKEQNIYVSDAFKNTKDKELLYDFAIIKLEKASISIAYQPKEKKIMCSDMSREYLQFVIDDLNRKIKQLEILNQSILQKLQGKDKIIEEINKQLEQQKVHSNKSDSFVSIEQFKEEQQKPLQIQQQNIIEPIIAQSLKIAANKQNSISIIPKIHNKLIFVRQVIKIHFHLPCFQPNWATNSIIVHKNSVKRLSITEGQFQKVVPLKNLKSNSLLKFRLIKYGINSLIALGIIDEDEISHKFSGQAIDQKSTVALWSDPKDKDGWITTNGAIIIKNNASLFLRQKQLVSLKTDLQTQTICFFINNKQHKVKLGKQLKEKTLYAFVALWSQNDEMQIMIEQ